MSKTIYEEAQYRLRIHENDSLICDKPIVDPFITTMIFTSITPAQALRMLFGRLTYTVQVTGTLAAQRVVLNGDYSEPEGPSEPMSSGGAQEEDSRG